MFMYCIIFYLFLCKYSIFNALSIFNSDYFFVKIIYELIQTFAYQSQHLCIDPENKQNEKKVGIKKSNKIFHFGITNLLSKNYLFVIYSVEIINILESRISN